MEMEIVRDSTAWTRVINPIVPVMGGYLHIIHIFGLSAGPENRVININSAGLRRTSFSAVSCRT